MEDAEEKIESLLCYREELDDEEKEVFDALVTHALELVRQRKTVQVHC